MQIPKVFHQHEKAEKRMISKSYEDFKKPLSFSKKRKCKKENLERNRRNSLIFSLRFQRKFATFMFWLLHHMITIEKCRQTSKIIPFRQCPGVFGALLNTQGESFFAKSSIFGSH